MSISDDFYDALDTYEHQLHEKLGLEFGDRFECSSGDERRLVLLISRDFPERGYDLVFTFGISRFRNPLWIYGRPEFGICLKSTDPEWWRTLCALPQRFYQSKFEIGQILSFGKNLFSESKMNAFLISPFLMSVEPLDSILLPDSPINIAQLIPIHLEEASAVQRDGLEAFIERIGELAYDSNRVPSGF